MKKLIKYVFSAVLIYLVFRRIDTATLFKELIKIPIWVVGLNLIYGFLSGAISNYRWSLILLKKSKITDVLTFIKCSYMGAFYGLFLPTSMAVDAVKWIPLNKKYGHMGKLKIASSVLIDRIIGSTAFFPVAMGAAVVGKIMKFTFPNYLFYVFGLGCLAVLCFYVTIYFVDFEKIFGRFKFFNKIIGMMDLVKKENKKLLIKLFCISIVMQLTNILPVWFNSRFLGVNFPLIAVYIFMPIISLVLLLPISVAGFGAREGLFLFFFSQLGIAPEKIVLVSTFGGMMAILNALFGGIAIWF